MVHNNDEDLSPLMPIRLDLTTHQRTQWVEITERVADRTIALPFHNRLTRMEIENVVGHLKQAIGHRLK